MATGPGDEPAGPGRDRLRAGHADREQVIEALKDAFVQGRLTKDELGARVGQALAARTYADLAALTADIPPGPAAARPAPRLARARRSPLARAATRSGICLTITAAAVWASLANPGNAPDGSPLGQLMLVLAVAALWTAVGIMACAVVTSLDQRPSRRQLPPRPGPGGHALDGEQGDGTSHDPVPPGPGTGQARAGLRAHKPPQRRQHTPNQAGRTLLSARPAPGTA
jgi:Domain of unknown function (DUF1707)